MADTNYAERRMWEYTVTPKSENHFIPPVEAPSKINEKTPQQMRRFFIRRQPFLHVTQIYHSVVRSNTQDA